MKKRFLIIAPIILTVGVFSGCKSKTTTYKVTFDYCYDGKPSEVAIVNSNEAVTKPVVPTREDYRFSNWYTEKEYENIMISLPL